MPYESLGSWKIDSWFIFFFETILEIIIFKGIAHIVKLFYFTLSSVKTKQTIYYFYSYFFLEKKISNHFYFSGMLS